MQCPCCRGEIENIPAVFLEHGSFTRLEKRVIADLAEKYPKKVSTNGLINCMYFDDPDGGPENVGGVLGVVMCRIRKKIAPFGWTIFHLRGGATAMAFTGLRKFRPPEREWRIWK